MGGFAEHVEVADLDAPATGSADGDVGMEDVALSDGTAGTYVDGMWEPVDGKLVWSEGGAQTLVFDRWDVRTTIQYTGPEAEAASLFAIADSMAAAQ